MWSSAADRAQAALGPISILINNAGVISTGAEATLAGWQRNFRVDVDGQFVGTANFAGQADRAAMGLPARPHRPTRQTPTWASSSPRS